jgi:DNA-binding transcriptional regulator YiaG
MAQNSHDQWYLVKSKNGATSGGHLVDTLRMGRPRKVTIDPASLMRQHIGRRLHAVREALGLRAEAMANMLQVSLKAYRAWESGQNVLPPLTAYRLLVLEKVPMEWLYAGDLRRADYDLAQRLTAAASEVGAAIGGPVPEFTTDNRPEPAGPPRRRGVALHEDSEPLKPQ